LKKENSQVVSATTLLKFLAPDGKRRLADMLDYAGIIALGKEFLVFFTKAIKPMLVKMEA
jgi:cell filamentation protein